MPPKRKPPFQRNGRGDGKKNLHHQVRKLQKDLLETRQLLSEGTIRQMIATQYEAECQRLETLRDRAVDALQLLVRKGVVTQDEVNEAVRPR